MRVAALWEAATGEDRTGRWIVNSRISRPARRAVNRGPVCGFSGLGPSRSYFDIILWMPFGDANAVARGPVPSLAGGGSH